MAETLLVPAGSVRGISDRHVVAEGEGTADPESLALECCDLVPDPLDPARPPRCSPIELAGAAYGGDDLIGWCAL